LVIGFEATSGTGQTTNIEVDLGSASNFTSAASGQIVNLGSDLSTAYGSTWNTRTDLAFGIVGSNGSSGPLFATSSYDQGNPPPAWTQKSGGFYGTPNSKITTLYGSSSITGSFGNSTDVTILSDIGTQTSALGGTLQGISTVAGDTGSWSATKTSNSPFGMSWASTSGVVFTTLTDMNASSNPGTGEAELYKIAAGSGNAMDLGTFTLGSDGILTFTGLTAIPEPSTYAMILGVFALGFVMLRRRQQVTA